MVKQFYLPHPTRKGALTQLRKNLRATNKNKPKRKQLELKSLKKHKSSFGGRPFFMANVRFKKMNGNSKSRKRKPQTRRKKNSGLATALKNASLS